MDRGEFKEPSLSCPFPAAFPTPLFQPADISPLERAPLMWKMWNFVNCTWWMWDLSLGNGSVVNTNLFSFFPRNSRGAVAPWGSWLALEGAKVKSWIMWAWKSWDFGNKLFFFLGLELFTECHLGLGTGGIPGEGKFPLKWKRAPGLGWGKYPNPNIQEPSPNFQSMLIYGSRSRKSQFTPMGRKEHFPEVDLGENSGKTLVGWFLTSLPKPFHDSGTIQILTFAPCCPFDPGIPGFPGLPISPCGWKGCEDKDPQNHWENSGKARKGTIQGWHSEIKSHLSLEISDR